MKLGKKKLAVLVGTALSFGVAGQASADVYSVSALDIDNLTIDVSSLTGAQTFDFETSAEARLNNTVDPTDGGATCGGIVGNNDCGLGNPRLSGLAQNGPGATNGVTRGEGDYTQYGNAGEYSNAEAEIVSATLLGDAVTQATQISESNIQGGTQASANTLVSSNTTLLFTFDVADNGTFEIVFDAVLNAASVVTNGDLGSAASSSSVIVTLATGGTTIARWAPDGSNTADTCDISAVCTAVDGNSESLQAQTTADTAVANVQTASGTYGLQVTGLSSGTYTLALTSTTSTNNRKIQVIPVPGTLMLLGTGLLLSARAQRRNKK